MVDDLLPTVHMLQSLAFLEIAHSALHLTKGSVGATVAQVVGRNVVLVEMAYNADATMNTWAAEVLLTVWALAEVGRYPFYVFPAASRAGRVLAAYRYNAWLVLYPVGIGAEMLLVVYAVMGASSVLGRALLLCHLALYPYLAPGQLR